MEQKEKAEKIPLVFGEFEYGMELITDLIRKHHPHLVSAKIKSICRNKSSKKAGIPVPGNVYKMSGKFEYLVDCNFVVEIALDVWNNLNPAQRLALVDHLLSRCSGIEDERTGEMKFKIIPPEIQEFSEIISRHGIWNESLVVLKTLK